jgi:hypothetical protein
LASFGPPRLDFLTLPDALRRSEFYFELLAYLPLERLRFASDRGIAAPFAASNNTGIIYSSHAGGGSFARPAIVTARSIGIETRL